MWRNNLFAYITVYEHILLSNSGWFASPSPKKSMWGMSFMTYHLWKLGKVTARSIASGSKHLPHQPSTKIADKLMVFSTRATSDANPVLAPVGQLVGKIPIVDMVSRSLVFIHVCTATVRGNKIFGRPKNQDNSNNSHQHAWRGYAMQRPAFMLWKVSWYNAWAATWNSCRIESWTSNLYNSI